MPPAQGGVTTFMLNLLASPLADEVALRPFTTSRPSKPDVSDNYGYGAMLKGGWRRVLVGAGVTLWHVLLFPWSAWRADIVQIQASDYQVFWESAVYAAIARLLRRKVILRIGGAFDVFHANAGRVERRLIAAALQLPNAVLAQSQFATRVLRQAGRRGPVTVLPNWIRTLPPPAVRRGPPTCLFIAGTEARRKGIAELTDAARRLHAAGCDVRFDLVAVTPSLATAIAAAGLPGVRTRGYLGNDQILSAMRDADIFLLPSHGEGFPNSLVEAMAAGMACIATPVGAVPEMAQDGAVHLVPVGDAAALADAVAALAASSAMRAALGQRARDRVMRHYTPEAALPALGALYQALAPHGRTRRGGAAPNAATPAGPGPGPGHTLPSPPGAPGHPAAR